LAHELKSASRMPGWRLRFLSRMQRSSSHRLKASCCSK
jgi:hypothetical protein